MDKRRMLRFVLCLIVIVMIMLYIAPKAYSAFKSMLTARLAPVRSTILSNR